MQEIPTSVLDEAKAELEKRLGDFRLAHSYSVAKTAKDLARIYDVDPDEAYTAGLLHDWDKDLPPEDLFEAARKNDIPIPPDQKAALSILHASTGAIALAERFPQLPSAIIQAISRHTMGAPDMSDLDMVVYIADLIEPSRKKSTIEDIRLQVGNVSLKELFMLCYTRSMMSLIERRRYIVPEGVTTWNALIDDDEIREAGSTGRKSDKPRKTVDGR